MHNRTEYLRASRQINHKMFLEGHPAKKLHKPTQAEKGTDTISLCSDCCCRTSCKTLCPAAEAFVNRDYVPGREMTSSELGIYDMRDSDYTAPSQRKTRRFRGGTPGQRDQETLRDMGAMPAPTYVETWTPTWPELIPHGRASWDLRDIEEIMSLLYSGVKLSDRQRRVGVCKAFGMKNNLIAKLLGISLKSVQDAVFDLKQKAQMRRESALWGKDSDRSETDRQRAFF
jgi:DNA-binding CsgD family transcriptional regulator